MKEGRKIVIALLLALCLGGQIFAGGSGDKQPAAASGPVTIDLWYGAAVTEAGPPPADWKVIPLLKEKLNINLQATAMPSAINDSNAKINAAAAANALPDIFFTAREPWLNCVKVGVLAPVDDLYALMPTRTKIQYDEMSRGYTTINGKSYGLASPGAVGMNEGILIRKDWLDKLGLKVPVTTEDYINVMKAFTFNDPDGNGRADTWGYGAFIEIYTYEEGLGRRFEPFNGAFGVAGTWNMTKANAGLNVRKPAYFDALTYIKRMVDEKIIDPNWLSYQKDDFRAAWKQGRFGIMREQNSAFASEANYAPFDKNFPNAEWILIDPPKGPTGLSSMGPANQGYRIYAISKKAADAGKGPAIAKLLEWMSSDEGYYLIGWGERGVNYMLDANGIPSIEGLPDPSKGFSKPEAQTVTQLRNMVFYNSKMELSARYPSYKSINGKTMSPLDILFAMQARPWTPAIGSDGLLPPGADLKRFYEQGLVEFVTGKRQLTRENWTAWVAEFDKVGGLDWEKAGIAEADANGYLR